MKLAVSLAAIAATLLFSQARAATLTVNSTADAGGTCPGAGCTLRQAIATALAGDTINFSLPANSVITLTSGELLIERNLTINGPGANRLTVQRSTAPGTPGFYIFTIFTSGNATISGLTVANGRGGIVNYGILTLTNSTVSGNSGVDGSGIFNAGVASSTITNSTISGNTSTGSGGGIYNALNTLTITNSTISGNTASSFGGGIYKNGGNVNARNTIIAQNTAPNGPDVFGGLISQGYNLIGNTSGSVISCQPCPGDQYNVNPMLGPLQDNGGPTRTHALLSGSTAIEGGHSSGSNTDQRGLARPVDSPVIPNATGGDGSDIGAYEVQADLLPGCSNINRIVNNNNDGGTDSLRAVIANVCAGSTITFAPNVTGAINLTSGELLINKTLTISGPGANLLTVQRSGAAGNFRIFNIASASVIATISGLTIANGNLPDCCFSGGGISNTGTLTLSNSTISGNAAFAGGGISNADGGIGNADGTVTITNSTISGNTALGDGGGFFNTFGGGVYNTGTLTITNSTLSGNVLLDTGTGAGILNDGETTLTNSTISGNSAPAAGGGGGGVHNFSGTVRSRNTIVALNSAAAAPDVAGALTSENFNLIGNNSGATIAPAQFSDQIGTPGSPINPMLGPLQNNGGRTSTRALLVGSTAIDKGHSSGSTSDQRGFVRPVGSPAVSGGDGSDIGAFEFGSTPVPIQVVSVVSRKVHGAAGNFDIALPLMGNSGVESRSGGATNDYQVVFIFPGAVTFNTASVTAGTGSVSGSSGNGSTAVTVNLTGVSNAQNITVSLLGVNNGTSTGDVSAPMGLLVGDTNGDRFVNSGDAIQTRSRSGQSTDATNFRSDVSADGFVNSGDAIAVRSRSGTFLP